MIIILALAGLVLFIPILLFLTLFTENILLLDSLVITVITVAWIRSRTGIHMVFCILLAIGILTGLMLLYMQHHLFWIFTTLSVFLWGYVAGCLLHGITKDLIWGIFLGTVVGLIALIMHLHARSNIIG